MQQISFFRSFFYSRTCEVYFPSWPVKSSWNLFSVREIHEKHTNQFLPNSKLLNACLANDYELHEIIKSLNVFIFKNIRPIKSCVMKNEASSYTVILSYDQQWSLRSTRRYEKAMEMNGVLCKQKTNKPHSHVLNVNF